MCRCVAGSIELVDVSEELPGLKYSKGLTKWKVRVRPPAGHTLHYMRH